MEKYFVITTDKKGRTILFDYDDEIKFFIAIGKLIDSKQYILAFKGVKILEVQGQQK